MWSRLGGVGVVAVLAMGVLGSCGSSGGSSGSDGSKEPGGSTTTVASATAPAGGDLFVVTATGGTLADDSLSLTGVTTAVTEFADRPVRSSGEQQLAAFVDGWADQGFVDDPPNAALATRGDDGLTTTVVELGQPVADGDAVTFPVTRVDAGEATGALSRLPSSDQPDDLVEPALFIDAGSSGTLVSVSIVGTWGAGDTRVALDGWDFSPLGGTSMGFQMGEPGTIDFTASTQFLSMTTEAAITGTFSGIGVMDDPTTLGGNSAVPAGSDLTIGVCGAGGPTAPLTSGGYELDIPATCGS